MGLIHMDPAAAAGPVPHRSSGILGQLSLGDEEFERAIREGLAAAEKALQDCVRSAPDPRVADLTGHIAAAGGKRMRPLLVLLGAQFGEPWDEGVTVAAVVAELVHLSSLYHDDVMDQAATRHGVPSANARWGERTAVLGGDWLLARSAQLAAGLGADALRLNAETAGRLVSGQLRELTGPAPDEDPVAHYFRVTEGKTAALLAMSLGIGALQAGAPEPYTAALAAYGEHLGIAFQIADDLLDLAAPATLTGKEQGKDLLAGVPSLPVLLARADTGAAGAELRALLAAGALADPADHRRALELFRTAPARARAEEILHQRLADARAALAVLPPLTARRALDALCDFVALRTS
ncbi:polyprenyl synthetase family protein [Streptomyces sp. NPDC049555]|uniref:polyprenyl synthetase family protein n=1 Tax=Streptomyces sp. NPDC049555 TaxID=3154930 RepID=UPI00343AC3D0